LKTLSWRAWATLITFLVSLIVMGEVKLAAEIGLLDTTVKLLAYYGHERLWVRIPVGRVKVKSPEYEI